jgi:hypothetical protein
MDSLKKLTNKIKHREQRNRLISKYKGRGKDRPLVINDDCSEEDSEIALLKTQEDRYDYI